MGKAAEHDEADEKPGPLHDPVTWYGNNYAGTQVTQWDFQKKELVPLQPDFPLF